MIEANISSAQHMAQMFPGSGLLQQESEGVSYSSRCLSVSITDIMEHTTIAAPSICIAKAIRNYFQTGALPTAGTLCQADLKPLVGSPDHAATLSESLSPADRKLFKALMAEVERGPTFPI